MKKEIYLKKSTRDAIKKNMKDDYSNYNKDYGFIGNALILLNPNNLPKVGSMDTRYNTPAKVIKVKKIDNKNGYDIYRVTYQEEDSIGLGEDVDTYHFDYAIKKTTKDSYEDLGWISDYDLLKEDDFYDSESLEYWRQALKDLTDTRVSMEDRIDYAEIMLDYLDEFKNKYVREEVKSDLRKFINKKENRVRDSKIKDVDWNFLNKLKAYDYNIVEKAMYALFPKKFLKNHFEDQWGDMQFPYADIANSLDSSKKEKLLKYLENNK